MAAALVGPVYTFPSRTTRKTGGRAEAEVGTEVVGRVVLFTGVISLLRPPGYPGTLGTTVRPTSSPRLRLLRFTGFIFI